MITSKEVRNALLSDTYEIDNSEKIILDYITQQEELTTTVKRYFELKAKGITTEAESLEHRELLNKINEMAGIEE